MTNKQWIEANLEGKVKARALRACDEQTDWFPRVVKSTADCFRWRITKEGGRYWLAVFEKDPSPDQWLPNNYVDVDQTPIEEAAQQALRKIEQAKSVNHIPDIGKMIEDKFLVWLEDQVERFKHEPDELYWAFTQTLEKYKELKNK
jgi:hypothetical protein